MESCATAEEVPTMMYVFELAREIIMCQINFE